jgi:hypothetical protein
MSSTTADSTPGVLDWVFFWKHPPPPHSHSNKERNYPADGVSDETVVTHADRPEIENETDTRGPERTSKGIRPPLTRFLFRDDSRTTNSRNLLHRTNSQEETKNTQNTKILVVGGTKDDEADLFANETPDVVISSTMSSTTSATSPSSVSHKENSPQSRVEEQQQNLRHSKSPRPHVDIHVDRIVGVLDTVFHQTPKRVISPVTKLFRFDDEAIAKSKDSIKNPQPVRGLNRSASRILVEHMVAPPPSAHHHGFWGTIYRNVVTEFGSVALMQHFSWMGHIFTFLWMLLPTSIVAAMWNHVIAYFRRLRDAIASNFRLPKQFRDPWKRMGEYMDLDRGTNDGGGNFKYALLMGATAFAYQTQQNLATRSRRAKRRRK